MPTIRFKHIFSGLCLFFLLFVMNQPVYAQITEAQAREMLAQRGIPEDTLIVRLRKKGYDPERIRPEQVSSFEAVMLETIKEIETDFRAREEAAKNVPLETAPTPVNPIDITMAPPVPDPGEFDPT